MAGAASPSRANCVHGDIHCFAGRRAVALEACIPFSAIAVHAMAEKDRTGFPGRYRIKHQAAILLCSTAPQVQQQGKGKQRCQACKMSFL
jgi:hypothetical protein